ncbi:MAG: protease family protein [Actinomycetota bacterium]|jgi:membrane protease YdiL (CAAX protease family)|nr:protease family protein [Actinomycetota bacterium]
MAEDQPEGHAAELEEGPRDLAPGWQPDPYGRFRHRWWDGERYTASVTAHDSSGVRYDPDPLPSALDQLAPPAPGLPNLVTAIVGLAAGVGLALAAGRVVQHDEPSLAVRIILGSATLWTGLLGAIVVVSRRRGTGSIVRDFGFRVRWSDIGLGFAAALVGRIISGLSLLPIIAVDRDFAQRDTSRLFEGDVSGWTWFVAVLVICVGAPLVEELFFRGLLQNRLVARFGVGIGIPVASILFGAAHLVGWQGYSTFVQAWAVTFGGMVLGVTYHYSKRLGTSIIAHSLFNVVAVLALWATSRT